MLVRSSLLLLLACRVGRPVTTVSGFEIASVRSPVVEPGLGDVLQSKLSSSLTQRGLARQGPPIEVQVWDASTRVIGIEGESRILSARLEIEVVVGGPTPRRTRMVLEQSFSVTLSQPVEGGEARRQAFSQLAERGAEDVADWLLYAPR
jgi:hypothetical protein